MRKRTIGFLLAGLFLQCCGVSIAQEPIGIKPGTECATGDSCTAPNNESSCSTCCSGNAACKGCCTLLPAVKQGLCNANCDADNPSGGCGGFLCL